MAERKIMECDVCSKPGAERYYIREDGLREWEVDLCQEHRDELMGIAKHGRERRVDTTPPPSMRNHADYIRGA